MSCIRIQYTPALLHLSAAGDRIAANPQRQCEFNRHRGGSSKILSGSGETRADERHVAAAAAAGDTDFGFESRIRRALTAVVAVVYNSGIQQ